MQGSVSQIFYLCPSSNSKNTVVINEEEDDRAQQTFLIK